MSQRISEDPQSFSKGFKKTSGGGYNYENSSLQQSNQTSHFLQQNNNNRSQSPPIYINQSGKSQLNNSNAYQQSNQFQSSQFQTLGTQQIMPNNNTQQLPTLQQQPMSFGYVNNPNPAFNQSKLPQQLQQSHVPTFSLSPQKQQNNGAVTINNNIQKIQQSQPYQQQQPQYQYQPQQQIQYNQQQPTTFPKQQQTYVSYERQPNFQPPQQQVLQQSSFVQPSQPQQQVLQPPRRVTISPSPKGQTTKTIGSAHREINSKNVPKTFQQNTFLDTQKSLDFKNLGQPSSSNNNNNQKQEQQYSNQQSDNSRMQATSQNPNDLSGFVKKYNIPSDLMAFDQDYFPQYTIFLLGEEEKNIENFRERVGKEKQKVVADLDIFQQEIVNLVQDLKVSMTQAIDEHFLSFIEKYKKFKTDVIDFKNIKLEVPQQNINLPANLDMAKGSNTQLIKELEELRYKNQVSKIHQYISEIQKESLNRILSISQEILQLMSSSSQLYNSETTCKTFKDIKSNFAQNISLKFDPLNMFIKSVFAVEDEQMANPPGNEFGGASPYKPTMPQHNISQNFSPNNKINLNNVSYQMPTKINNQQLSNFNQDSPVRDLNNQYNKFNNFISSNNKQSNQNQQFGQPSHYQNNSQDNDFDLNDRINVQCHKNYYNQVISLNKQFNESPAQIILNKQIPTTHSEIILCVQAFSEDMIATGSKDGEIEIYNPKNKKSLANLQAHKGPICCLGKIGNYLVSGSDHGDCSIIVWDMQEFKPVRALEGHTAAVVSLISLNDDQTLVSASYDKDIIFWNTQNGGQIQKLSGHKSSVSCICLSEDGQYLVSGGLDNILNVYKLIYSQNGQFESAFLERTFNIPCFISQMQIVGDYIFSGHRDGKIRVIDLQNGDIVKNISVSLGSVSELLVFKDADSQIKILGTGSKESNVFIADMGGNVQRIDCSGTYIEFGCGIGPKMQHISQNQICFISQLPTQKEISIYDFSI